MAKKLKDFLSLLEEIAPSELAEPWDNPGLQVGSYFQEVEKVFLALDPTLRALRMACERKAQLLLTHHPLIFNGLSLVDFGGHPGNVIREAARNDISVVAAHTNLDVARGGINDILADLVGLENVEVLKELGKAGSEGIGRIGDLPGATTLSVFARNVRGILGTAKLKIVGERDARVRRVAVVGGSGGSLLSTAFEKGADLLLTGDVGHHHALEGQSLGMALIDGGHFHLEKKAFGVFSERLKDILSSYGWKIEVEWEEGEADPAHFL
jgi:dinuclear metal center YbgI/SA1388 family protein